MLGVWAARLARHQMRSTGWQLQRRGSASGARQSVAQAPGGAAAGASSRSSTRMTLLWLAGLASAGVAYQSLPYQAEERSAVLHSVPRTCAAAAWGVQAGLAYKRVQSSHVDHASPDYDAALAAVHEAMAERLLQVCQHNGGVYIKLGQFLTSLRAIPEVYRSKLEVLQDRAEPRPFEAIDCVLTSEFGADAGTLFVDFDHRAKAAASLAQVHKARLRSNGQWVAVKVQYPALEMAVAADLATLSRLASLAAWAFPDSFHLGWVLADLKANLERELDFTNEWRHAEHYQRLVAGRRRGVTVPAVVPDLTSKRVLTMEWIDGARPTDLKALEALQLRPHDVGVLLLDIFAEMTYKLGFVHGDAHSGNVLVRPAAKQGFWWRWFSKRWREPEVVLLDWGLVIELPDTLRRQWCEIWCSFVIGDQRAAVQLGREIAGERSAELLPALLKPGGLHALPAQEQQRLRATAGIESLSDVGKLLEALPRPLVEILRVSAQARHMAAQLDTSLSDRLRCNAVHALKGMARSHKPDGSEEIAGDVFSRTQRMRLSAQIYALRMLAWWQGTLCDFWQLICRATQAPVPVKEDRANEAVGSKARRVSILGICLAMSMNKRILNI